MALSLPLSYLDPVAIAIELIHTYSLVHDDLPAMDNDDYRRGKASCHRAFDEATAILAGDALQSLAFQCLGEYWPVALPTTALPSVLQTLCRAIGPAGLISGQSLDLTVLNGAVSDSALQHIHHLKTAILIQACVEIPLLMTSEGSQSPYYQAFMNFSKYFGLAFQMHNDYLEYYDIQKVGKKISSDKNNQKCTFATIYTQEKLQNTIETLYRHATEALQPLQPHTDLLLTWLQHGRLPVSSFSDIRA